MFYSINRLFRDIALPYAFAGAGLSGSLFIFSHFWRNNSNHSLLWDMTVGGSLFGTLTVAALWHPSNWFIGMWGGALLGFAYCNVFYGNHFTNRDRSLFEIQLPGLTPEEREKQRVKDYITELSLSPPILSKSLRNL